MRMPSRFFASRNACCRTDAGPCFRRYPASGRTRCVMWTARVEANFSRSKCGTPGPSSPGCGRVLGRPAPGCLPPPRCRNGRWSCRALRTMSRRLAIIFGTVQHQAMRRARGQARGRSWRCTRASLSSHDPSQATKGAAGHVTRGHSSALNVTAIESRSADFLSWRCAAFAAPLVRGGGGFARPRAGAGGRRHVIGSPPPPQLPRAPPSRWPIWPFPHSLAAPAASIGPGRVSHDASVPLRAFNGLTDNRHR